jgi:hypothetical protein
MVRGLEDATDSDIELDDEGCISRVTPRGEQTAASRVLAAIAASDTTVRVGMSEFDCNTGTHRSCYDPSEFRVHVHGHDVGSKYRADAPLCNWIGLKHGRHTMGSILTHELLGHAATHLGGGDFYYEPSAIHLENAWYHGPRDERLRCNR